MSFEGQELRTGFYNKEQSKRAPTQGSRTKKRGEGKQGWRGEKELGGRTHGVPVRVLVGSHSFPHKHSKHCVLWKGNRQQLQCLQMPGGELKEARP